MPLCAVAKTVHTIPFYGFIYYNMRNMPRKTNRGVPAVILFSGQTQSNDGQVNKIAILSCDGP